MLIYLKRKAQSTAEYVMLFTLVIGALTLVQNVVKKGLAGKVDKAMEVYLDGGDGAGDEYTAQPFRGDKSTRLYRAAKNAEYTEQRQTLHGDGAFGVGSGSQEKKITIAGDLTEVKDEVGNVHLDKDGDSPWKMKQKPLDKNDADVKFEEGSEPM